jgi:hypothetical protein
MKVTKYKPKKKIQLNFNLGLPYFTYSTEAEWYFLTPP